VLVCVKSPDTDAAARSLRPHLAADAVVVSLQNGVDQRRAAARRAVADVFAAVVYVGAYMNGPGIVRHTGRGDLVLGASRADAARPGVAQRLAEVAALFEAGGIACPLSDDIDAALWTKLVINCAFNAVSALAVPATDAWRASRAYAR